MAVAKTATVIISGAVLSILSISLTVDSAEAGPIQPHRGIYSLTLASTDGNSDVVAAEGIMEFEWAEACDGYTVSQKTRVELSRSEGPGLSFGWIYNSWEAKDGESFRFYLKRLFGSGQSEQVRGRAMMDTKRGPGSATFSLPEESETSLPKGVIFPSQHTLELLERLEADELTYYTTLFDGAGDGGLSDVSAIKVRDFAPGEETPEGIKELADMRSWRLNMAFFRVGSNNSEPEQEQNLRLFANGISDALTFDYGEFAIDANLSELILLSQPDC